MFKRIALGLLVFGLVVVLGVLLVTQSRKSPARPAPPAAPTGTQTVSATPAALLTAQPTPGDSFARDRFFMVRDQIQARGVQDQAVLDAMLRVHRDRFVPPDYLTQAYADHPLPIGYGQTISQPYIVALMSEALKVKPGDKVLEIGTGSGYQAAVLADMGAEVYTVEIIPELAQQAEARLQDLGYDVVHVLSADGYNGWQEHAPYDAIIVTAAPDHLPQPLASQLRDGGRLVIPIGPVGAFQTLWLFEKNGADLQATNLGGVSFVPLTGGGR
jgi:protein-L-isoaspartate(D-aspartate) O-methyltransferase